MYAVHENNKTRLSKDTTTHLIAYTPPPKKKKKRERKEKKRKRKVSLAFDVLGCDTDQEDRNKADQNRN